MNKKRGYKSDDLKRKHPVTILLNDKELEALNLYCKKYRIKSKSKLIRDSLFTNVLKRFDSDPPTLFEKNVLDRLEKQ